MCLVSHMDFLRCFWYSSVTSVGVFLAVYCQANDERFLDQTYGDSKYISIATGNQQSIYRAPAIATIIAREDIVALGATHLDEVLETVPGLHVIYSPTNFNPIYEMRGITAQTNRHVLMLLDGIPITQFYFGDQGRSGVRVPLDIVQRIEIIRGPGSALHGADAFAGVINIVTKTSTQADAEIKVRGGSFGQKGVFGSTPFRMGFLNGVLSVGYEEVGSSNQIIEMDQQSIVDQAAGTQISHAPGEINNELKMLDLHLNFDFKDWRVWLAYVDRWDAGVGAGISGSLDPLGKSETERYSIQLSKQIYEQHPTLDAEFNFSYLGYDESAGFFISPPGLVAPTPIGPIIYPDGLYSEPGFKESHFHGNLNLTYMGWSRHTSMVGVGVDWGELYGVEESRNYDNNFLPLADVIDFDKEQAFIESNQRVNRYIFLQDEWVMGPDWTFTSGVRVDSYSDFGTTVNPRLALVWFVDYDFSVKILYGRAYRAPSFGELYLKHNPVLIGNEELDPEEMEMFEVGFNYLGLPFYEVALNVFYYDTDKFILEHESTVQNLEGNSSKGLELEIAYNFSSRLVVRGNYAYQDSDVVDTENTVGGAAEHQAYLRTDWMLNSKTHLNFDVNWISSRSLVISNKRLNIPATKDKLDAYASANLSFKYMHLSKYKVGLTVRNLFDSERFEPTDLTQYLPNHLPLAGRSFVGSLSVTF